MARKGENDMEPKWLKINQSFLKKVFTLALLGLLGAWLLPAAPALAQGGAPPAAEKPAVPEEKKEEAPTTTGPMICDTCVPLGPQKLSMSLTFAYSLYPGLFDRNWKYVSAGGNFGTFYMPLRVTFGVMKNWEMYVVAPFIVNSANSVTNPGPNGDRAATYTGIGDISWFNKYQFLEETDTRPAVSGIFGIGFPTGHASHLNPRFLGVDAIGTGSFAFTTGINLYKWLKPFLIYSNIWITNPVNIFPDNGSNVRSRSYVTANLAAELPLNKKIVALFEVYSNWTWTTITTPQGYQTPQTVLGVMPGIEFLATDKLSMTAAASFDLLGKNGVRKFTPMLTVFYSF
jgi:hypothetical protein